MDTIVIAVSLTMVAYFVLAHILMLTLLKERHLLNLTKILYVLTIGYAVYVAHSFGLAVILLSCLLISLFVLVYHLAVSSILYETSVYVKLIVLLKSSHSLEDILKEYNSKHILDGQLTHLVAAKRIQKNQQQYTLAPQHEVFLIGSIKRSLKNLIDPSM